VLKLSKLYKVNHVGVNMYIMYKLLCINYNDHHGKFSIVQILITKLSQTANTDSHDVRHLIKKDTPYSMML